MEKLQAKWDEGKFVCVGLDSDMSSPKFPDSVPAHPWAKQVVDLSQVQEEQLSFNCWIIDATKDLVCAYKPNLAFYRGDSGHYVLYLTILYVHNVAPDVPVILDAKQADIGSTNDGYVAEDFGYYEADAVTVNPYLGMVAMKPFLDQADKGIIVLCHTSNEGAGEFQDVMSLPIVHESSGEYFSTVAEARREGREDGTFRQARMPLYQFVAYRVAQKWNHNGNCAVVVGATYADKELGPVREIMGDSPILLPGIGAQAGDLEATVLHGQNGQRQGMIINSSRGVIFASSGEDFAEAARLETLKLHKDITRCLAAA
jgi:orotidine-5'-phosphate decarboxylase